MRGYEDYEDLDEYEEDEYYDEDGAEEEYEQEKKPKPTQEELEYLELRKKLKESYRKRLKKETGSTTSKSLDRSRKDNFGSFFGPSQPVIAPRVIQESKSLSENQHLVARVLNPSHHKEKVANHTYSGVRPAPRSMPKVDPVKVKLQKLKETRDYSFLLSDDAPPPAPRKEPPLKKVSAPYPDSRSTQIHGKERPPLSNGSRQFPSSGRQIPSNIRQVSSGRDERKQVSMNGKVQQSRPRDSISESAIRNNPISSDHRKPHVSSNARQGHDRPADFHRQPHSGSRHGLERQNELKNIPLRRDNVNVKKAVNAHAPTTKSSLSGLQRHMPPPRSSAQTVKQPLSQRNMPQDPYKVKMVEKHSASSTNPQTSRPMNKPIKPISSQTPLQNQHKKRPPPRHPDEDGDDGFDYRSAIRNMFRYNPNKFRDDEDTSDMEAGFDEILKEERRSALIARKEDEREQQLIEEEERRERLRKEAKRRKIQR